MNKQELMENYTMEQLADRIIELEKLLTGSNIFNSLQSDIQSPLEKSMVNNYESKINQKNAKIDKLEREREELRKIRDEQVAKVNELKVELDRKETAINQIDSIICELFGISHNGEEYTEDFKELLKSQSAVGKTISDFLPAEPVEVAAELINATYTRNKGKLEKKIDKAFGNTSDIIVEQMYSVSELRQIAEHLLIYCNANGREE